MFFTLSKVLFFLITPFFWCVVCIVIGCIQRKKSKRWFWIALIFFLFFTNPYLYRKVTLAYQSQPAALPPDSGAIRIGILLSGFTGFDTAGNGYFTKGSDRFIQAANLYHSGTIKKLLISGGNGNIWTPEPPESQFIKSQLVKNGIPDSCILIERKSRNTYENALYTKQIIDSAKLTGPFLLITSALHMPRSMKIFNKLAIPCIPYPCDFRVFPQTSYFLNTLYPNISLFKEWEYLIKEIVGTWVYQITGKA